MKFSTKAEYGLRAMANLAGCFPAQKNIREISEEENISLKYLERIVGELRKNNLVISAKGKSGGYTLTKKPKLIRVGEVVEALDGPIAPTKCSLCSKENKCSSSIVWLKLASEIRKTLNKIKLKDIAAA